MNIFTVLSQGKGRLNEENLSSMLAYLLSPSQTHGLGDLFLQKFFEVVSEGCGDKKRFDNVFNGQKQIKADILLESAHSLKNKQRFVDIEIRIYKPRSKQIVQGEEFSEIHRIAIENKIKTQSATKNQLKEEFEAIIEDTNGENNLDITMVFLTPQKPSNKLDEQYEALDKQILGSHKKVWLYWTGQKTDNRNITSLIKNILKREAEADIPPITEYLRHTLKAFIRHLVESSEGLSSIPAVGYGIEEVVFCEIAKGKYRIERYENSAIRVVNLATQKYETAKPVLRMINKQKGLGIDLLFSSGNKKNTRSLGKEVMEELIRQEKDMKK